LNNLVIIFLFVLFMLLRFIIAAKGQSAGSAQKKGMGRDYAPPPASSDDGAEGLFSAYAASADYPQAPPSPPAERLLVDEEFPPPKEPALAAGNINFPGTGSPGLSLRQEFPQPASAEKASPPSAAGTGLLRRLNCLSPLKQAVVLKEIFDRPRALSDAGESWNP
jgi:hypothetical protein